MEQYLFSPPPTPLVLPPRVPTSVTSASPSPSTSAATTPSFSPAIGDPTSRGAGAALGFGYADGNTDTLFEEGTLKPFKRYILPYPPFSSLSSTICENVDGTVAILCDNAQVVLLDILESHTKRELNKGDRHNRKHMPSFAKHPRVIAQMVFAHTNAPQCIAFSSNDGSLFAIGCKDVFHLYDCSNNYARVFSHKIAYVPKCIDVTLLPGQGASSTKKYLIAVGGANGVEIYTYPNNALPCYHVHPHYPICAMSFSSNGDYLAVACMDGHIGIWSTQGSFKPDEDLWISKLDTNRITSVSFSSVQLPPTDQQDSTRTEFDDDLMLAIGSWEGEVFYFRRRQIVVDSAMSPRDENEVAPSPRKKQHNEWVAYSVNKPKFSSNLKVCSELGEEAPVFTGNHPGTMICWSPNNRMLVRTIIGSQLRFLIEDVATGEAHRSFTVRRPIKGVACNAVKQQRLPYFLIYDRDRTLTVVPWPTEALVQPGQEAPCVVFTAPTARIEVVGPAGSPTKATRRNQDAADEQQSIVQVPHLATNMMDIMHQGLLLTDRSNQTQLRIVQCNNSNNNDAEGIINVPFLSPASLRGLLTLSTASTTIPNFCGDDKNGTVFPYEIIKAYERIASNVAGTSSGPRHRQQDEVVANLMLVLSSLSPSAASPSPTTAALSSTRVQFCRSNLCIGFGSIIYSFDVARQSWRSVSLEHNVLIFCLLPSSSDSSTGVATTLVVLDASANIIFFDLGKLHCTEDGTASNSSSSSVLAINSPDYTMRIEELATLLSPANVTRNTRIQACGTTTTTTTSTIACEEEPSSGSETSTSPVAAKSKPCCVIIVDECDDEIETCSTTLACIQIFFDLDKQQDQQQQQQQQQEKGGPTPVYQQHQILYPSPAAKMKLVSHIAQDNCLLFYHEGDIGDDGLPRLWSYSIEMDFWRPLRRPLPLFAKRVK